MKENLNIFDFLLIIFILGILLFFFIRRLSVPPQPIHNQNETTFVKIVCHGKKDELIPLPSDEKVIYNVRPDFRIEISSVGVRVVKSDCLRNICVHSGMISRKDETLVCVPNKIVLSIVNIGGEDVMNPAENYDAVTR